jgi:hypothetical protein
MGNSSVPPSVPVATIFGVLISVQSNARNSARTARNTSARISKMALASGRRRSSVRLSSRVAISAPTFPEGSSGSSVSASAMTSTSAGTISTPVGARSSSSTAPVTLTTDSRGASVPVSTRSSSISSFSNLTWIFPVVSRTMRNAMPPRSRISWTQPATVTSSPGGASAAYVRSCMLRGSRGPALSTVFRRRAGW